MKDNDQEQLSERESGPVNEARPKKPYIKPAFVWERVFETSALSCGKINSTQAQCRVNRKSS